MRWRLYAGIGAVFALGGVAGGLLGIAAERDRLRKMEQDGPVPIVDMLGRRLEAELKLDPAQSRRVREIYATVRPEIQLVERERRRRLREMLEQTQPQILEILTPKQKQRYSELQQKIQQRLRLRDPNREGPPPHHRDGPPPGPKRPPGPKPQPSDDQHPPKPTSPIATV